MSVKELYINCKMNGCIRRGAINYIHWEVMRYLNFSFFGWAFFKAQRTNNAAVITITPNMVFVHLWSALINLKPTFWGLDWTSWKIGS